MLLSLLLGFSLPQKCICNSFYFKAFSSSHKIAFRIILKGRIMVAVRLVNNMSVLIPSVIQGKCIHGGTVM